MNLKMNSRNQMLQQSEELSEEVNDDSEVIELDELEEFDKLLFTSSTAEDKEDVTEDRSSSASH